MIHLKSFELIQEYREIKPFKVDFNEGLNVIVGENGSGKSTMFMLLTNDNERENFAKIKTAKDVSYKFFDTEKQNPRIKSDIAYDKNPRLALMSRFSSHGESAFPLIDTIRDFKNELVFIDEPEAGISLMNQVKLLKTFNTAIKNNCQIIIATHSYIFIKSVEQVFDLVSKKWISSEKYLSEII